MQYNILLIYFKIILLKTDFIYSESKLSDQDNFLKCDLVIIFVKYSYS